MNSTYVSEFMLDTEAVYVGQEFRDYEVLSITKANLVKANRYETILAEVVGLLEAARSAAARAVNTVITATYWQIGRRIVEAEQAGKDRAGYGEGLLKRLGTDLTGRFGRGFSWRNLH